NWPWRRASASLRGRFFPRHGVSAIVPVSTSVIPGATPANRRWKLLAGLSGLFWITPDIRKVDIARTLGNSPQWSFLDSLLYFAMFSRGFQGNRLPIPEFSQGLSDVRRKFPLCCDY